MSIKDGITIGSVSCTIKATGLSWAMVVRIVHDKHDKRRLVEAKSFLLQQNAIVAPESSILFIDDE